MRVSPVLLLATFLAGCSSPGPAGVDGQGDAPVAVAPPLLVLADGTYQWHEVGIPPSPANAMVAYDIVTQTAVNPCDFQGSAYFNNRQIPTSAVNQRHRNGTLTVTFEWATTDYALPTVVLGYQAPGMSDLAESPRITNGQPLEVRITADPRAGADAWSLYACLNREGEDLGTTAWQPGPFLGSFTVHAQFQGDPELPEVPSNDTRRTSRGG